MKKRLFALAALFTLAMGAVAPALANHCCAEGAACCKEQATCCKERH